MSARILDFYVGSVMVGTPSRSSGKGGRRLGARSTNLREQLGGVGATRVTRVRRE